MHLIYACLLLIAGDAGAQIRAEITQVLISATVVDEHNRFLNHLPAEAFHLFEEGVEQRIGSVTIESGPASIALVVDVSASMKRSVEHLHAGVRQIIANSIAGDEFCLILFDDRPKLSGSCTTDASDIERQMQGIQPDRRTALRDAIVLGFRTLRTARHPRRAIVVLSDGYDTASAYSARQVVSLARESDVRVYAIATAPYSERAADATPLLRDVAKATGGRYFEVTSTRDFRRIAERIDIRQQYVLAYTPANRSADGKYRRVTLKLDSKWRKAKAFWKQGYYAVQ